MVGVTLKVHANDGCFSASHLEGHGSTGFVGVFFTDCV